MQLRFDLPPPEASALAPGVWLHEAEDAGAVFVHGFRVHRWRSGDSVGRRFAAVQLVTTGLVDEVSVRNGFKLTPDELRQLIDRFEARGLAGLIDASHA
jgi:hypothetical protein